MAYNSDNRSERLLQGRRFTTDNLSLGQEAFTDVFDLGAGEILTDDGLIPTGSTQLAYSGSSQNGEVISGSVVNPSIETDVSVLKYYWRKKLKQAADGQREVYYFTTSDPSSVSDTVTSDQLIETDQQTNFVSPKYIIASDSPNNTESSTPGYKVVVYKDTASSAGSITSSPSDPASYVFDFKTGVLTWVGSNQPSSNQFVYITVYQYIGRTLRSQIDDGSIGGSGGGASSFAELSGKPAGLVSGSAQVNADSITNFDSNVKDKLNTEGVISGSSQITITESQISDLGTYLTSVPTGTVSGSSQITITESQISDLGTYLTSVPSGTISGSAGIVAGLVGQNLNIGTLNATKVITNVVSQSISFATGSNKFGDEITDVHTITGSLKLTGSFSFSSIDGGNF
jgi:hypothetical protein